jgi:REP element-mobilizing transposase RayT
MRPSCPTAQLSLRLAARPTWGGARAGAGRKPGRRPRVWHRSRTRIRSSQPCHVTLRVLDGLPSLRTPALVKAFERTLACGCERGSFRVVHYSLQHDHVHLIVETKDAHSLGRGMMSIGTRLARAVNRVFGRTGRVLADRYHARPITTPREARNALAYVLLNVRKHLVRDGVPLGRIRREPDPASSGRWFDGWRTPSKVVSERAGACVAQARTWLLATGWRRHGLIDLGECPRGTRRSKPRRRGSGT